MIDHEILAPLTFFESDETPGSYSLLLSDLAEPRVMAVFEECGQYGNGYGWEGVARSAVRNRAPELDGRFDYDCEAGMFAAYGQDPEALRGLGSILRDAYLDDALLRDLIESGDPDEFD
ncbi:immunity 51 family protein [Yinghuangia sp. YIM S10712]|uniref:immunity 51 family protein n=1 Tax=Yinghuangia sp. YIM S10712 TaxID=3436930 RepID=UPI003F539058